MSLPSCCDVIIPVLQEAGAPLTNITLNVVRSYFTEAMDLSAYQELIGFLNVTANSGSPTLDVKFQFSPDKLNWIDTGDNFAQVVSTNGLTFKRQTANFGKYVRMRLDVAGTTPSYTFSLYLIGKG